MSVEQRGQFKVSSIQPSWFWAQLEDCPGKGRRIRIPFYHEKYDDEIIKKLRDLEVGDRIYMGLVEESESGSKWLPKEVEKLNL